MRALPSLCLTLAPLLFCPGPLPRPQLAPTVSAAPSSPHPPPPVCPMQVYAATPPEARSVQWLKPMPGHSTPEDEARLAEFTSWV